MKEENEFRRSLKCEKTLQELAEKAQIHPIFPTKFNAVERAKLRAFEQGLLKGKDIDIEK